MAERVNGILKTELISNSYPDIETASVSIAKAITIYNYKRRHSSINYQLPDDVHNQKGPQIKEMEKLLLHPQKKRGKNATNLNRSEKKNLL